MEAGSSGPAQDGRLFVKEGPTGGRRGVGGRRAEVELPSQMCHSSRKQGGAGNNLAFTERLLCARCSARDSTHIVTSNPLRATRAVPLSLHT